MHFLVKLRLKLVAHILAQRNFLTLFSLDRWLSFQVPNCRLLLKMLLIGLRDLCNQYGLPVLNLTLISIQVIGCFRGQLLDSGFQLIRRLEHTILYQLFYLITSATAFFLLLI